MRRCLLALVAAPLVSAASPPADYGQPYRLLQQANEALDPSLATSAYAMDARLVFDYPGRPLETFEGQAAIRSSYVRTFSQVDPGTSVGLRFRFEPPGLTSDRQRGVYRIDATAGGRPIRIYGRFSVKLVREDGAWRFAEDRGGPATEVDFESLPE